MAITVHGLPDNHESVVNAAMRLRRPVTVTAVAVGVFGLLSALLVPWGSTGGSRLRWFVLVSVSVFLVLIPLLARYQLQRRLKAEPDEPWTATINEERFSSMSTSATTDHPWSTVGSVLETPESFVLRRGREILAVLPKQDFTDDDLAAFRRLVADLGKG